MNKTLKKLFSLIGNYKFTFIFSILASLLYVVSSLLIPIVQGEAIGKIVKINEVDFASVNKLLIVMLVLLVLASLFQYLATFATSNLAYLIVSDLRKKAFKKLMNVPLNYIDSKSQGDIVVRISGDIEIVSEGLMHVFQQFITGVLNVIGTIVFMFYLCLPLAFLVILLTPLSLFVASYIAKGCASTFDKQAKIKREMGGLTTEALTNFKVVKCLGNENESYDSFVGVNDRLYDIGFKAQFFGALVNPCTRFVNALIYASLATLGGILTVSKGLLDVAKLYSFLTYASQYTKPFNEISNVLSELQNAIASATSIFELIDEKEEEDLGKVEKVKFEGNFEFENVFFSYSENQKLIEDFNLKVDKGSHIALVGPTGCGKTTMINLIMRFYDVNKGSIKLDGIDIASLPRKTLHNNIGMVLQDTWIFEGTIYENVTYGKDGATREEVIEACKMANCHNFIKQMANGYDTVIKDDDGLSQGQKQLLCIARLFLNLPPILILDEATSNIDTRMEINVQNSFKKLMKGRTTFIIAHRLQTIKNSDLILVMKNGSVIERGKHEELLKKEGFYKELYYSQFKETN